MQPSSLILLAIVVVWAAYLVPQWVRRRDEMSQSRAGDRFSGGLRVLKRRERSSRSGRSGDPLLTSPRVIVDTDGELLYIPADRLLAERLAGSSMSLPQSARPGETLLGTPAPVTPEPAASARPDQEEPTAPAEPEHVPAVEAEGRVEVAARQSEAAIQGEPEAKTGKAAPVASATPDSATPAPVTTTAPSSPSAEDSMAELEAGLLAGFGLTTP